MKIDIIAKTLASLLLAFAPALALAAEPVEQGAVVVGVRGSALAQSPGEEPRVLRADSELRAGDRIVTAADAALGVLVGDYYAGFDEATTAVLGLTPEGEPDVQLEAGRVRLLDTRMQGGGRISTPGLLAANAGTDTDAFAFPEKAGVVSMVCPTEGGVAATQGAQSLTPAPGGCAVAKPGEPIYMADGGHPPLPILGDGGGFGPLAGAPADRFGDPLPPVALGLPGQQSLGFPTDPLGAVDQRQPCDLSGCGGAFIPPTNPTVPGGPPGGTP